MKVLFVFSVVLDIDMASSGALRVNLRCLEKSLPTASIAVKTQKDSFGGSNSET